MHNGAVDPRVLQLLRNAPSQLLQAAPFKEGSPLNPTPPSEVGSAKQSFSASLQRRLGLNLTVAPARPGGLRFRGNALASVMPARSA